MRHILLFAVLLALAGEAQAFTWHHHRCDPCCQPPPGPCVCYVEKKVTAYKPVWKEEKVQTEVTRVEWKKEVVPVKVKELVTRERTEERTVIYHKAVPKEIERDIQYCVLVPECIVDPCTCCPKVFTRPQIVSKKVKVTILQDVAEPKKEKVKVAFCETVEKTVNKERMVPEHKKEKITETRKYCVMEPYTTVIQVPVPMPPCGPCGYPGFQGIPGQPAPAGAAPKQVSNPVDLLQYLNSTGPQVTAPWSSPSSGNGQVMSTFPTGITPAPAAPVVPSVPALPQ